MKNIFVIGGSGFLGYYLIKELKKNNYNIYAHVHKTKPKFKNIKLAYVDLGNSKKFKFYIQKNQINYIINLASIADVEKCEKNKKLANYTHIQLVTKILNVAKALDIPIVHMSTDQLYGGKIKSYYSEKSTKEPLNYYAITKSKSENILLNYQKSLILRSNFIGKNFSKSRISFTDKLIFNLNKNKKINLWNDIYFSPVFVTTLVFVIIFLIKKKNFGIFNVSSKKISKFQIGQKIAKLLKLNKSLIKKNLFNISEFIIRPKNSSLSNNKLIKKYPNLAKKLNLTYQLQQLKKQYDR
jgi:dTDP-4-dehydrorhamnose reductase